MTVYPKFITEGRSFLPYVEVFSTNKKPEYDLLLDHVHADLPTPNELYHVSKQNLTSK